VAEVREMVLPELREAGEMGLGIDIFMVRVRVVVCIA